MTAIEYTQMRENEKYPDNTVQKSANMNSNRNLSQDSANCDKPTIDGDSIRL